MRALTWLTFAVRPLDLATLAVAAVIDPDHKFKEDQKLDADEAVLEYCGSFVRFHPESKIVEISHFSVTQYLTSRTLPDGLPNPYFLDSAKSHTLLLNSCFTWLMSPPFINASNSTIEEIRLRFSHEFSLYAVYEWPLHGRIAEMTMNGATAIQCFLGSVYFADWAELWEMYDCVPHRHKEWWKYPIRHPPRFNMKEAAPRALYYAALFGFPRTLQSLLGQGEDINSRGGTHKYPLMAASMMRRRDIVEILLSWGADIHVTGASGSTVLHCAIAAGWWKLIEHLLNAGADIEVSDEVQGTALHVAVESWGSNVSLVKKLICNENINSEIPDDGCTPLQIAARNGHVDTALLLINAGANVNAGDFMDQTPLHAAAADGFLAVVKLLLERDANPGSRDYLGYMPIHRALESGWVDIANLFAAWPEKVAVKRVLDESAVRKFATVKGVPSLSWITWKDEIRQIAEHYPNDHIMQEILGCSFLIEYPNNNSMSMALLSFDESVELNPHNASLTDIDKIQHIVECWSCGNRISGVRYKNLSSYPTATLGGDFCSTCIESQKNHPEHGISTIVSIPSCEWIKSHFLLSLN